MPKFYNVRDKVLLNFKNINSVKSSKKLNDKYYEFFVVKKSIGKQIYRFEMFAGYNDIHNVFHVFLFEPYINRFEKRTKSSFV